MIDFGSFLNRFLTVILHNGNVIVYVIVQCNYSIGYFIRRGRKDNSIKVRIQIFEVKRTDKSISPIENV